MNATRGLSKLAQAALEIEQEEALRADALGFMGRPFVQATLPHSQRSGGEYERRNGLLWLHIQAPTRVGLPFGRYPRLLLAWISTEAVRTKSPRLELGPTLSGFMAELGLVPTGGRWGSIGRLKDQMRRLFSSTITIARDDPAGGHYEDLGFRLARRQCLWWDARSPEQATLWGSWIELTSDFYEILTERPVPIDLRVLKAIRSPLGLDLYAWLSYRNSYLRRPTLIPWELLHRQFGAEYGRLRDFRRSCLEQLRNVLTVYPAARLEDDPQGLRLLPSPPHVRRLTT
ncbi:MAG: pirin [Acidobacteria bacterium]|nr:pirin [Acidobacteriota bacterium]